MSEGTGNFDQFFEGAWVDFHVRFKGLESAEPEIEYLQKVLSLDGSPHKLLDIPCGLGRHAIPLAELGVEVTGVERSQGLLDLAQRESSARGLDIQWIQGDMREVDLDIAQFDSAICMWTSLGYFGDQETLDFLKQVHQSLKPGGKLVLDLAVLDTLLADGLITKKWHGEEPLFVLEEFHWNPVTGCNEGRWIFCRDGQAIETQNAKMRIWTAREFMELAKQADFEIVSIFGSLEFEPFEAGDHLYLILGKPAA